MRSNLLQVYAADHQRCSTLICEQQEWLVTAAAACLQNTQKHTTTATPSTVGIRVVNISAKIQTK